VKTFFARVSFQIFQQVRNQYQILRFLIPILFFWNFFYIIFALLQTLNANVDEMAQKKCVLELNFASINGLGEPSC
jgi:hypothetical protein